VPRELIKRNWPRGVDVKPIGRFTDDTLLNVIVAQALTEGWREKLREKLVEKLVSLEGVLRSSGAGYTTLKAIAKLRENLDYRAVSGATNGAALRAFPIGIAVPSDKLEELLEVVEELTTVTHGSKEALAGAAAIALAASKALEDAELWEVVEASVDGARRFSAEMASAIERGLRYMEGVDVEEAPDVLAFKVGTSSLCIESVPAAICAFKVAGGDLAKALKMAVNAGGDTDSVASMSGGLCGAFKGLREVPEGWLKRVERLPLKDLALKLVKLRSNL